MQKRTILSLIAVIALSVLVTACTAASASTSRPMVAIASPPSNSQFHPGDLVTIQSTATDAEGIANVELSVDGNIVRTDPSPAPQNSFTVNQSWTATPGAHVITVRAFNTANVASDPAAISVTVLEPAATPTPAPTATPLAGRTCTNNSAFVTDVTVPDGTTLAPGQTFNKVWRVRNTGTCTWGAADTLVFAKGEAMTINQVVPVTATAPGATADLLVAMTAPTTPGTHTGLWRMKGASGVFFGVTVNATVNVSAPAPTAASCPFTPVIESFTASAGTITAGQSAALSWGRVLSADRAEIDNDIGGVAAPGSVNVTPKGTTTYTLTATCGAKVTTAQVTITVVSPTETPTTAPTNTPTATATPKATP